MSLIEHVLVATDLSPPSMHAVDRAFDVARTTGARITVMNALGLDALGPLHGLLGIQAESVGVALVENRREALSGIVADRVSPGQVRGIVMVEKGLAARVIPAYVAESRADLVVVGARGEGVLRRFFVGSTASHLLRKSHCPVLIVKRACRTAYRRVLIAIDFSVVSELVVRMARAIAPQAHLFLVNVFDVPFEGMLSLAGVDQAVIDHYRMEGRQKAMAQLHDLAARVGLDIGTFSVCVQRGSSAQTMLNICERERCDLVVMGKHGTHVTEELLLGSVTKHILNESKSDLLAVIDSRRAPPALP